MEIRTLSREEYASFCGFAQDVFIDYYTSLIGKKQAEYMADLFLSPDAVNRLTEKGAQFRILMEDGDYLGFCEYLKEEEKVFLSKLYVRKDRRHQGLGKKLFEDCVNYTKENGLNRIYLTVNKYNTPSYETYRHLGFEVIDAVVNDIGKGYVMDDYIMEIKV